MATKPNAGEKLVASNKKALHDYFVQKAEAGVS
jgi:tmRNA-binding protein